MSNSFTHTAAGVGLMSSPSTATTAQRDAESTTASGSSSHSATSPGTGGAASAVGNAAFARALENGGYFIDLGPGLEIDPENMSASVNLEDKRQVLPGVHLRELVYQAPQQRATVTGDITIPHLRSPQHGIEVSIDNQGRASLDVTLTSDLPVFKNKTLQVALDEHHNLTATLNIEPTDLMPASGGMRNLTVTGGGTFLLAEGKLNGNLEADLAYANLGSGHFAFTFTGEGRASGSGNFDFSGGFLNGASASLAIDDHANLRADVGIPATEIEPPISGLSITEGTVRFTMDNSMPGGGLEAVKLVYNGFGEATMNANIRAGLFTGSGNFSVTLPELTHVRGNIRFQNGLLTGDVTVRPSHFPRALQVREGSITATLTETGDVNFDGEATIALGPAGTGQLRAFRENGLITIGTIITLENIPGLQSGSFSLTFTSDGTVEGEADIATDDSLIPGLTGTVRVEYRNNLWSGETEIAYTREDPTINGSVTMGVRQTEEGALVTRGEGELTVEIIPGVEGMAGVVIDEQGNVILNFAITQTEPYELFPEQRQEREFLNISRNIPLWAGIVVAVIRIRAGARAGVGPGQIRNSRFEGTWEITSDEPPDFAICSEFYMPAFVEGYVAFGAGLGVDVLLGSLTGGIEAMATAGLYGAVSVVPQLSYEDGDWLFNGTATLAAGARLKLSLNAWAEIEALWVTVWERTWELASHTMPMGPDLVLRAAVNMNLSNPSVPEITFDASDTDNESFIAGAMPEDGPPSAGTREALKNRAEWNGPASQPGADADSVPPEQVAEANASEPAPAAPPRPPAGTSPGGTPEAIAASPEAQQDSAEAATGTEQSLPPDQALESAEPRYPRTISLQTLNEPPAPVPRTAEQKQKDLDAALACIRAAAAQTNSTEELSDYFPRIRERFQLTTIGFEKAGGDRLKVQCTINPMGSQDIGEDIKGVDITEGGVLWQSDIKWRTAQLGGDTVGTEMEATKLGPDHPQGTGANGQDTLRAKLPKVGTGKGASRNGYIRGHLLNDNLGGPGKPENLYPITGHANSVHHSQVEKPLKELVNDSHYWVYYKVTVNEIAAKLDDPNPVNNKVDADFHCEAYILRTDGTKSKPIKTTISSRYRQDATASDEFTLTPDEHSVQTLSGPDALLSSRRSDRAYIIDESLFDKLRRVRNTKGWSKINQTLLSVSGIAGAHLSTLQVAYRNAISNNNQDQSSLLSPNQRSSLTHINNSLRAKIIVALNSIS